MPIMRKPRPRKTASGALMYPVRIELTEGLWEQYAAVAESVGLTLPQWAKMALASYYSRWKSPAQARKKKTGMNAEGEGMYCTRCKAPATQCRQPELHKEWDEWESTEAVWGKS